MENLKNDFNQKNEEILDVLSNSLYKLERRNENGDVITVTPNNSATMEIGDGLMLIISNLVSEKINKYISEKNIDIVELFNKIESFITRTGEKGMLDFETEKDYQLVEISILYAFREDWINKMIEAGKYKTINKDNYIEMVKQQLKSKMKNE